jgi:putative membrane protein
MQLLLLWLINALSLLAVPYVLPSVRVDSFYIALVTALVLGLVNTLIRPLLLLVTLPITILTLGLFTLVINGLLFWFVASFVDGFHVAGFWSAFWGAIVYSIISWAASWLLLPRPRPRIDHIDSTARRL